MRCARQNQYSASATQVQMWNATAKLNPDQEFVPRQSSFTEWLQQVRERRKSPTPEPYQVAYYPVQFDSEPPRL